MNSHIAAGVACLSIAIGVADCRAAAPGDAGIDAPGGPAAAFASGEDLQFPTDDAALLGPPAYPAHFLPGDFGAGALAPRTPVLRPPAPIPGAAGYGLAPLGPAGRDPAADPLSRTSSPISGGEALVRLISAGQGQAAVWLRQLRGSVGLGIMQFAYRAATWMSPGSRRPLDLRVAHAFTVEGHRAEVSLVADTIDVGVADPRPGFPFQRRVFLSLSARF